MTPSVGPELSHRRFHQPLSTHLHPHTYAFYGAKENTTWGEILWKTTAQISQLQGAGCSWPGELRWNSALIDGGVVTSRMDEPEAAGDETVPADASGRVLGAWGATQCFRLKGFDHQHAFGDPTVRRVTLYSLAMMAQASACVQEPHPWSK